MQSYKSAGEKHQRQMSYILSRATQEAPNLPDSVHSYHLLDNQLSTGQMISESAPQSSSTNSLAVTQASLDQHPGKSDVNSRAVFAGANINSISGCQFQIFNGPVKIIQDSHKRRRFVIESDDED